MPKSVFQQARAAALSLADAVDQLDFSEPTTHVYNPLRYAWAGHEAYLRQAAGGPRRVLFLGMNPGPFGMAQTGVPFGEVDHVRDWIGIEEPIEKPDPEHPKRPIDGFACTRSEVSGRRLWGAFKERFGRAEAFFEHHFVANYCPLVFMEATGTQPNPGQAADGRGRAALRGLRCPFAGLGVSLSAGVGDRGGGLRRNAGAGGPAGCRSAHRAGAAPQSGQSGGESGLVRTGHAAAGRARGLVGRIEGGERAEGGDLRLEWAQWREARCSVMAKAISKTRLAWWPSVEIGIELSTGSRCSRREACRSIFTLGRLQMGRGGYPFRL